jgi:hypothetical protein
MAQDRTRRGNEAHERAMKHVAMLTEASMELRAEPKIARRLDGLIRGIPLHWRPVGRDRRVRAVEAERTRRL